MDFKEKISSLLKGYLIGRPIRARQYSMFFWEGTESQVSGRIVYNLGRILPNCLLFIPTKKNTYCKFKSYLNFIPSIIIGSVQVRKCMPIGEYSLKASWIVAIKIGSVLNLISSMLFRSTSRISVRILFCKSRFFANWKRITLSSWWPSHKATRVRKNDRYNFSYIFSIAIFGVYRFIYKTEFYNCFEIFFYKQITDSNRK